MIPVIMMIGGGGTALYGFFFTLYILVTPMLVKVRSVNGQGELVETRRIKKIRIKDRKDLLKISVGLFCIGFLIFASGFYLGFSYKGQGIGFYDLIYGSDDEPKWDRLSSDGSYIADNGGSYKYYLVVKGNEFEFCGEKCEDTEALRKRLMEAGRENRVIVVDNYAVSARLREAEALLDELGMQHETEEV